MKNFQTILITLLVVIVLALVGVACIRATPTPTPEPTDPPVPTITPTPFQPLPERHACLEGLSFAGPAVVMEVEDTDTIKIETPSGVERLDFVGVNGWNDDEREEAGEEFVKELLPVGAFIELALDPEVQEHNGKLAAYVYFGETFVNLTILEEGHARPRAGVVDQLVCADAFKSAGQ